MSDDLSAAAKAASYLASTVASIRALTATGMAEDTVERLARELNRHYDEASHAIHAVAKEVMRVRSHAAQFGDIIATTGHEAALEMVRALNFELFGRKLGLEPLSPGPVRVWPNVRTVLAEINLETERVRERRELARQGGAIEPPGGRQEPPGEDDSTGDVIEFIPGGFVYLGKYKEDLSGKPLDVLKEFVKARFHRVTARHLLGTVWKEDAQAENRYAVDAVSVVREALRKAIRRSGVRGKFQPLPNIDYGLKLAWELKLPTHQ